MRQQTAKRTARTAEELALRANSAELAGALETGLIFTALLIAVCAALYILNGEVAGLI